MTVDELTVDEMTVDELTCYRKKPNIEYKFDVRPLAEWLKGLEYPQNQSDQFNLRVPGFESRVRDGFTVEGINQRQLNGIQVFQLVCGAGHNRRKIICSH